MHNIFNQKRTLERESKYKSTVTHSYIFCRIKILAYIGKKAENASKLISKLPAKGMCVKITLMEEIFALRNFRGFAENGGLSRN